VYINLYVRVCVCTGDSAHKCVCLHIYDGAYKCVDVYLVDSAYMCMGGCVIFVCPGDSVYINV